MQARRGAIGREGDDGEARRLGKPGIDGVEVRGIASRHHDHMGAGSRCGGNQIAVTRFPAHDANIGMRLKHARHHVLKHPRQIGKQNGGRGQIGCSRLDIRRAQYQQEERRCAMDRRGLRLPGPSGKTDGSDGQDRPPHGGRLQGLGINVAKDYVA